MGSAEENIQEKSGDAHEHGDAAPPSYNEASQQGSQAATAATDSKRPHLASHDAVEARPTVDSPFNFPPAYTASASYPSGSTSTLAGPSAPGRGGQNYSDLPEVVVPPPGGSSGSIPSAPILLAIPQTAPQPTSPFLAAYNAPVLLRRGISGEAFLSFLSTLSAFLRATVSERALAHAADVGRGIVSDIPRKFSRDTAAHVKDVGRRVGESARRGRLIAAGIGALAGTVSIPVAAAARFVDATLHQLPAAVGGGLSKRPLSPRERADAYVAVAQRDWFRARGLTALLCSTAELVLLSAWHRGPAGAGGGGDADADAAKRLVNLVHRTWEQGPEGQLRALQGEFGLTPLEITDKDKPLDIGTATLWLVLTDAQGES
ncbi:hypothetical protein F4802DRAFT_593214 [Xylaria palmicola]|nr:hypothetical protein F4802DRAFT_593214 [Xylaria palmicola]